MGVGTASWLASCITRQSQQDKQVLWPDCTFVRETVCTVWFASFFGTNQKKLRTAFERQTHWFVIPFRCQISSPMGDLIYLKRPKINSLCLLPPSHLVLATLRSYMFLKFICVLTGNKNDLKFLSDWVAQQDFFMTNEFFSLPQSFIIQAIVSTRRCPCAFKNRITFFPCTLQQMQSSSKHTWRLRYYTLQVGISH